MKKLRPSNVHISSLVADLADLRQSRPVFCRREPDQLTKDPVKVGNRLETCLVSYLANSQPFLRQQDFRLLNSDTAQVVNEG